MTTSSELYATPATVKWWQPIVIDFETYYDDKYKLGGRGTTTGYTTEAYIRSSQFECIGVSVKVGNNTTQFYRGETGIAVIAKLIEGYPNHPFVSHNTMFDMGILGLRYGMQPKITVDTITLARLSGLDRVAGGSSLAKLSAFLQAQGLVPNVKGTAVYDMKGVHLAQMTEETWTTYSAYCNLDTDLCRALYDYTIQTVPLTELVMADITTKMFTMPSFVTDVPLLKRYIVQLEEKREDTLRDLAERLNFTTTDALLKTLRSAAKFAELLTAFGIPVPMKWSDKQGKKIPALSKTDKEFLDLQNHENEVISTLVQAKLGTMSNMEQTRAATLIGIASRGMTPIPLGYAAAHTHRFGGLDAMNVQNMSKRTKEPVLRRSFTAPLGSIILASDSSQIEARLNAYIANQADLIQLFLDNRDPYIDMAATIFGRTYEEIYQDSKVQPTKEGKFQRSMGKEAVLSCGYGMSANEFRRRQTLSGNTEAAELADNIVGAYRAKNSMICQLWRLCDRVLAVMLQGEQVSFGGPSNDLFFADGSSVFHGQRIPSIRLPNGTYLWYQNLRKEMVNDREQFVYDQFKHGKVVPATLYGAKLTENLCQALAFAVLKEQAVDIASKGVPIAMNVHDEWVSVVPKALAAISAVVHYTAMEKSPPYIMQGLLDCEVDIGMNYADLKTIDVKQLIG